MLTANLRPSRANPIVKDNLNVKPYARLSVDLPSGRTAVIIAQYAGTRSRRGSPNFHCKLIINGAVIFNDDTLSMWERGPELADNLKNAALTFGSFVTLRKGDTDEEYFDDYTITQNEWIATFDCEYLSSVIMDYSEKRGII